MILARLRVCTWTWSRTWEGPSRDEPSGWGHFESNLNQPSSNVCVCAFLQKKKKKETNFSNRDFWRGKLLSSYFFDFFHSISTNYFSIHQSFFFSPIKETSLKFHRGEILKSRMVLELRLRFFDIVEILKLFKLKYNFDRERV